MNAERPDRPRARSSRPPRPVLIVGAVIGVVALVAAVLAMAVVTRTCGCQPNPEHVVTGVVTNLDAPAARFTLQTQSGTVTFQLPAEDSPMRPTVQAAYATRALLAVSYLRRQTAPPYAPDGVTLAGDAAATP